MDDLRSDAVSAAGHPFARTPQIDRIAARGVRFANAFVTTALCSPSRASLLTGAYPHVHGVRRNEENDPDPAVTSFPRLLQQAGYETAFVGKWHMRPDAEPRAGFDYWLGFAGQGEYLDPTLNENGKPLQAKGYVTDLLTDAAVRFLKRPRQRPFCLLLWHKAVHAPFTPAPRHATLYAGERLPEPPGARDRLLGKPAWLRALASGGGWGRRGPRGEAPASVEPRPWNPRRPDVLDYARALAAVDDGVGRVLATLEELGLTGNTWVVFAGDNGYLQGEHHRRDKRLAYEESIRIPLLVCGPGIVSPGRVSTPLVLNVDVAPTLLGLARLAPPPSVQGRSLRPLLEGRPSPWRTSFLYAYWQEPWLPGVPSMLGVRTESWKYVRYPTLGDEDELYDLARDAHELRNLASDPGSGERLRELRQELLALERQVGLQASVEFPKSGE